MSMLFRHGRIFDGVGEELLEEVEVLVEGGRNRRSLGRSHTVRDRRGRRSAGAAP